MRVAALALEPWSMCCHVKRQGATGGAWGRCLGPAPLKRAPLHHAVDLLSRPPSYNQTRKSLANHFEEATLSC